MPTEALNHQPLLGVPQLAHYLGVSRKALYNALDRGQIPTPIKIGNRLRWRPEQIEGWLETLHEAERAHRGQR